MGARVAPGEGRAAEGCGVEGRWVGGAGAGRATLKTLQILMSKNLVVNKL